MIDRGKHNVVGIHVDAVDYEAAVEKVAQAAHQSQPLAVAAVSVHGVMMSVMDKTHRYRLNQLDVVVPDGQPVRWALNRIHKAKLSERVYGPQMMFEICRRAAADGLPIFLFGGYAEMLNDLQTQLRKKLPDLKIAGMRPAKYERISADEKQQLIQEIRDSGAKILFVGLGCPKQEVFVYEMRDALSMPAIAVGAALNFHAGHLPQAPRAMQRCGFEWAFRLSKEPRRLWRRYLLVNPLYLGLFALQATGLYVIQPTSAQPPQQEMRYG
ncbi:MAG TPA: WecB/TagA/CpsF family glycosyltransferase [Lacipirellulaceae bacterium]|nr:WecB/TagA/CpsF family glycosyltransferase [Lacipirellulaceae bacterium]